MCVHIVVHMCRAQYNTEMFWLSSLLSPRRSSLLTLSTNWIFSTQYKQPTLVETRLWCTSMSEYSMTHRMKNSDGFINQAENYYYYVH